MRDLEGFIEEAKMVCEHKRIVEMYQEIDIKNNDLSAVEDALAYAVKTKDSNVLSFVQIINKLWLSDADLKDLAIARQIVSAQWSSAAADAIGSFQKFGTAQDIPFLEGEAKKSVLTWFDRDDENQQFFRKCINSIEAIGSRDQSYTEALNALKNMAKHEPFTASYWARKRLNDVLGDQSPYRGDDLDEMPDADLEWPGNANKSVLQHALYADNDNDTVTVYQAFSDEIGKAAAATGTLDVQGFSKKRMTWIKPSFYWMMYRSGWGQKDKGQSTILKLRLWRPEFFHLIQNAAMSHASLEDHDHWQAQIQANPNRIQWDPDRDKTGRPIDRRAFQLGIGPDMVAFYVQQCIASIEDITTTCERMRNNSDTLPSFPQEPLFWSE